MQEAIREEKCDVTLPWLHYFWMTTKPTTTGDGKENGKKYYDMKLPNFTNPLYGVGEQNTKIVAFFFKT